MNNIIKSSNKGSLIVLSGPSGSGKDSICERLKEYNDNFWVSVSATTRKPRMGEEDGISYFFKTTKEFEDGINNNEYLEYAKYNNEYYGTPRSMVSRHIDAGEDVILVIEVQGALKIKHLIPEAIFIFIMPPTMKDLIIRLKKRGTESNDKILNRFKTAYQEINELTKYNYVVVNDELDVATRKVNSIIEAQRCMVDRIEEVYVHSDEEEIHELLIDKDFVNEDIDINNS